jgi:hypothetical protein
MWTACVVSGIAFGAVGFMLMFMMALLRESLSPVRSSVLPLVRKPLQPVLLSSNHFEDECRATECKRGESYLELLENEGHVKEEYPSGLITLNIRSASAGWRSIHTRLHVLRGYQF